MLDEEEVEDARRQLPENVFNELYLAEPSDDAGNPFGLEAIRRNVAPLSGRPAEVWGWDLGKARDFTVGIGLDASGACAALVRDQLPWEATKRLMIERTGSQPALVDSTGLGDPIVEGLQVTHPNFEGFKFSPSSKQQLMEGLAVAIHEGAVHYPPGPIVVELESFEYEYTRTGVRYSAPPGMHDDCVSALALAVRQRTAPTTDPWRWAAEVY